MMVYKVCCPSGGCHYVRSREESPAIFTSVNTFKKTVDSRGEKQILQIQTDDETRGVRRANIK